MDFPDATSLGHQRRTHLSQKKIADLCKNIFINISWTKQDKLTAVEEYVKPENLEHCAKLFLLRLEGKHVILDQQLFIEYRIYFCCHIYVTTHQKHWLMGQIAHLRNQFTSMKTFKQSYNYIYHKIGSVVFKKIFKFSQYIFAISL